MAMSGLNYLHDKSILHNDIKEDNILLDGVGEEMKAIIIDFGKEVNGKCYCFSASDKQKYRSKHPQISPDVVDGVRHQDKLSDISTNFIYSCRESTTNPSIIFYIYRMS